MITVILIILVMGAIGLIFGLVLGYANKRFATELDPRIHIVEDVLPKGQCGACGFAGCQAYAEAVVMNPDVPPNLCIPGKAAVADKIAELTGKKAKVSDPVIAHVKCANPIKTAVMKYRYTGMKDCVAASILQLGPKDCQYGCIGLGTCARNCPFGAIKMSDDGLPIIDVARCTGCGKCTTACPKKIIEMVPADAVVYVSCSSRNKAADARKHCHVPCLGCGLCVKQCTFGACRLENNLALVDFSVCIKNCKTQHCLVKCPTKAFVIREDLRK